MKSRFFALFALLALAAFSASADEEMIQVIDPATANKVAIVVTPEAFQRMVSEASASTPAKAGQDNYVALNLMVGLPSGIRAEVFPFTDGNIKVGVEGYYGVEGGLSPGYGGGLRVQIRVAAGAKNALYVSPGVDVYVSPTDTGFFGHYGNYYYVATNADVSWLHEFNRHFGFELGARAGVDVQLNGVPGTRAIPELGLFTGVRF